MENLLIEWRVLPQHVGLLPVAAQTPNFPTADVLPALGDLVQIAEQNFWVVGARQWERAGQDWRLVLQIAPATDKMDIGSHTLH